MLSSLLGADGSPILQYLVVFAIMVVLLSLFALGAKRFARGRGALMGGAARGRQPRLGIVDIYELDRQRQLILLRRDNVEHLLMVGGPNDLVVERDIRRSAARAQDDLVAAPERDNPDRGAAPDRGAVPERGTGETEVVVAPRTEPSLAPLTEPAATAPAAAPRPAFPGVRSRRVEPPSLGGRPAEAPLVPEPLVAAPPTPPAAEPAPQPSPQPSSQPLPQPLPPALRLPPRPAAGLDPAGASDMARDLERALGRPGSPVVPSRPPQAPAAVVQPVIAPVPAPPPPPPPPPEPSPPEPSPVPAPEVPSPPPAVPEVDAPPPPPAAPVPPEPPAEPEAVAEPEPEPEPEPVVVVPPPPPKAPEPPAKAVAPAKPASTTFSVEEIEAEFARLLGRPLDRKE